MTIDPHLADAMREEVRKVVNTMVDETLLTKVLEGRVAQYAMDVAAEGILNRYFKRRVLPLLLVLGVIAGFFGWQVRETKNHLDDMQNEMSTHVKDAERQVALARDDVQRAQQELNVLQGLEGVTKGSISQLQDMRGDFREQLGRISQQRDDISASKLRFDQHAAEIESRGMALRADVEAARENAQRVSQLHQDVQTAVTTVATRAKEAETAAQAIQSRIREAEQYAEASKAYRDRSEKAAGEAIVQVSRIREKAEAAEKVTSRLGSIENVQKQLVKLGSMDFVTLRSNQESQPIALRDVDDLAGDPYVVTFATPDIEQKDFPLRYTISRKGKSITNTLSTADAKAKWVALDGTNNEYQMRVDFVYSARLVPDFLTLRVRAQ